jgi:ABC-type Na+ transport system ATPase subunit NatA/ABC-type transport system involved in multi-copper enzyme maturation permease subunit
VAAEPISDASSLDGSKGESALVVDHLSKRFGDRTAFDEVSFEVGHGEVFGFLGPNGAGKTTTVRTLGTLIAPSSGSAIVAGIPLSAENGPAIRARISIMPESPGLYLRLTVMENLECFAGLYELDDIRGRIERALRAVNLIDRASDQCRSLSKGLRQRVALARALLNDPTVLFLDEPTSGLDPVASREVHGLIASLRERGVTIFLTTHRLEEAERLCHRVAILNTTLTDRPARRATSAALQAVLGRAGPCAAGGSKRRARRFARGRRLGTGTIRLHAHRLRPRDRGPAGSAGAGGRRCRHPLTRRVPPLAGGRVSRADRRGRGGQDPMSFSWTRVGAILHKELRDYRRNRFVIGTMTVMPLLFVVLPMIQLFNANADADTTNLNLHIGVSLLYMLVIPAFLPSTLSAYSVVGEREQGTLEPVLITPIRREEFLIGKALAAFVPTLVIAYMVFGIFLAAAALFAHPVIVSAIYAGTHVLVQLLFTPLLAGWGIWVGIAVSARSADVRVAQQLSVLGSLPLLAILALMSLNVITVSTGLAVGLAAALLAIDLLAWRAVAAMFDRERLITGTRT